MHDVLPGRQRLAAFQVVQIFQRGRGHLRSGRKADAGLRMTHRRICGVHHVDVEQRAVIAQCDGELLLADDGIGRADGCIHHAMEFGHLERALWWCNVALAGRAIVQHQVGMGRRHQRGVGPGIVDRDRSALGYRRGQFDAASYRQVPDRFRLRKAFARDHDRCRDGFPSIIGDQGRDGLAQRRQHCRGEVRRQCSAIGQRDGDELPCGQVGDRFGRRVAVRHVAQHSCGDIDRARRAYGPSGDRAEPRPDDRVDFGHAGDRLVGNFVGFSSQNVRSRLVGDDASCFALEGLDGFHRQLGPVRLARQDGRCALNQRVRWGWRRRRWDIASLRQTARHAGGGRQVERLGQAPDGRRMRRRIAGEIDRPGAECVGAAVAKPRQGAGCNAARRMDRRYRIGIGRRRFDMLDTLLVPHPRPGPRRRERPA